LNPERRLNPDAGDRAIHAVETGGQNSLAMRGHRETK
jgi:hypothetical protein